MAADITRAWCMVPLPRSTELALAPACRHLRCRARATIKTTQRNACAWCQDSWEEVPRDLGNRRPAAGWQIAIPLFKHPGRRHSFLFSARARGHAPSPWLRRRRAQRCAAPRPPCSPLSSSPPLPAPPHAHTAHRTHRTHRTHTGARASCPSLVNNCPSSPQTRRHGSRRMTLSSRLAQRGALVSSVSRW